MPLFDLSCLKCLVARTKTGIIASLTQNVYQREERQKNKNVVCVHWDSFRVKNLHSFNMLINFFFLSFSNRFQIMNDCCMYVIIFFFLWENTHSASTLLSEHHWSFTKIVIGVYNLINVSLTKHKYEWSHFNGRRFSRNKTTTSIESSCDWG